MKLLISFRGKKVEIPLDPNTDQSVIQVKTQLASSINSQQQQNSSSPSSASDKEITMSPGDFKLIHKGKVLSDDIVELYHHLLPNAKMVQKAGGTIRLMATGISSAEKKKESAAGSNSSSSRSNNRRIRNDLTEEGRREIYARQRLGRNMLAKAGKKEKGTGETYGFHRIETLPMLPEQKKAKEILDSLANDPGILACMAKHKWHVGCLAEMYPEGKVGESEVCIMGLNQNKGQKILLRLRTDDLKGFRKILSIRKVLFHELAHNVHSEHDGEFFKLMRQIEKECNEMDWTQGNGQAVGGGSSMNTSSTSYNDDMMMMNSSYQGGTFRLGGGGTLSGKTASVDAFSQQHLPTRELAARAAMMRLNEEEKEIEEACGCGEPGNFNIQSESATRSDLIDDEEMKD